MRLSVTGTTGGGNVATETLPAFLGRIRQYTDLPLAVGFGVNQRRHVVEIGEIADAAIVGTAIIAAIDAAPEGKEAEAVNALVCELTGRSQATPLASSS